MRFPRPSATGTLVGVKALRAVEAFAVALLLVGCASAKDGATRAPADAGEVVHASAEAMVTIAGQLQAHDGGRLQGAEIVVEHVGSSQPELRPSMDDAGRFEVRVPAGVYRIRLDAPDHRAASRSTVVTDELRVVGRLRGSARVEAAGATPPPPLQWSGESPTTVAVRDYHARWSPHADALRQRIPDGKNVFTMPEAMRIEARELATKARADIDAQLDPNTRGLLRAQHMALFFALCHGPDDAPAALQDDLAAVVANASPLDLHFALTDQFMNFASAVLVARRGADAPLAARTDRWLEQQARAHPVGLVAAGALGGLMFQAKQRGDTARLAELEALAGEPRFEGTGLQGPPPRGRGPRGSVKVGDPLPAFDLPALDDPHGRITSADRRGRIYLIDIWSTTCGPCVQKMSELHLAYAAVNGIELGNDAAEAELRGLSPVTSPRIEFVSISVDESARDVEAFRRESWSMPWTHAIVASEGLGPVWKLFGVGAIPAWVLVDGDGVVLAVGGALQGDTELMPTLERALTGR
jgi:thiol-disulfide isomerase/thioredoxin